MSLEGQIGQLEIQLKGLIIEWERYFAGDRRTPPQLDREKLERRLRLLADGGARRAVERFRLEQLQHRFMTYNQMWERMLRAREEGRGTAARAPAPNVPRPPSVEGDGENDLYERYVAAKSSLGQATTVDRAAFQARLDQQRQQLEARLGRSVELEVKVDEGRVKLKARAADRRKQG